MRVPGCPASAGGASSPETAGAAAGFQVSAMPGLLPPSLPTARPTLASPPQPPPVAPPKAEKPSGTAQQSDPAVTAEVAGNVLAIAQAAPPAGERPRPRPGALRDLVEEHLRKFPDTAFTPHQVGKVLTRSAGAVANALDKLTALGTAQMVAGKPRTYRLAPAAPATAPDAVGDPGISAETAPSAV
jgi:hypothetical protein